MTASMPEAGDPITVLFEPERGETRGIRIEGELVAVTIAGLWWQPDGETTALFAPWRYVREIEARRLSEEA